jgi:multiple sugar transport system substrate-binding protein
MRDYLGSKLSEVELVAVRFVSDITDKVGPLPPPPPAGAGEAQALLIRTNQRIAFGEASVSDAARDFYTEANDILARG